jgi:hypothetical protein
MPRVSIGDKLDALFEKIEEVSNRLEQVEITQFDIVEFLLEMKRDVNQNQQDSKPSDSQVRLALTKKKRSEGRYIN